MTYTYSIKNDFKNKKVDLNSLINEIINNNLPLSNIIIKSDNCIIYMVLELLTEQINILNDIINNHDGDENTEEHIEKVKILEEQNDKGTQGHFQSTVIDLYISGVTGTTYKDLSFPYSISLFSSEWLVNESQISDIAEFQLSPDTIIGVLTKNANKDDTILNVSNTVIDNLSIGYWLKVNDEDVNRVLDIDKDNNQITIEKPLENNYNINTYIKMTIKIVPRWRFTAPGFCSVGESKIGASFIPANTIMRLVYHNTTGTEKWFGISIDYLY